MGRKRIYLKAYFRKNLGDDMFVEHILHRYPAQLFYAYARAIDLPHLRSTANLRLVPAWRRAADRLICKIRGRKAATNIYEKRAAATVHIGGSIFIEPKNFKKPADFYYPKNMFYIGCNFGPYQTDDYRAFIEERLRRATDVCFRDTASRNEFAQLDTMRAAPDVLFGYKHYPKKQKGHGFGISVIDVSSRAELADRHEAYCDAMASLIDHCNECGIPVTLFSFCTAEGDMDAIADIMKRKNSKNVRVCEYNGHIASFLDEWNACEYIVATRFHAMVIGWMLGKKVYPIVYSDKQRQVMKDIGYSSEYWDLTVPDDRSFPSLYDVCLRADEMKLSDFYIRAADEQFAGLDAFMTNS